VRLLNSKKNIVLVNIAFREHENKRGCTDDSPHSAALHVMPLKIGNLVFIHRETSICNQQSEISEYMCAGCVDASTRMHPPTHPTKSNVYRSLIRYY